MGSGEGGVRGGQKVIRLRLLGGIALIHRRVIACLRKRRTALRPRRTPPAPEPMPTAEV